MLAQGSGESENTFKLVFDNAPDGMLLADVETMQFRMANNALCRELGYTQEEMVGLGVADIHPADDLPHVISQFEKQARGEILVATDIPVKRKDGSVFYADISSSETIVSGRPHLMGIFRDVTDRKSTEESLSQSEEKFRLAMETTNDALWDWNTKTNQVYRNPRHATMLGYEPHELTAAQDEWETRIHPDDKQWVLETLREHLAGKTDYWKGEYRLRTKSGDYVWVLGRGRVVSRAADGSPERMIGTNIDITERRNTEQALKQSEQMLRSIIDHSAEVFYIHNTQHKLTYVSPQSRHIFGYTPEEMMVKWTTLITDNPINDEGLRLTERAIETGERQASYLLEIERKDGEPRIIEIDESPVKDEDGNVVALTGGLRDVTERRQAEKALHQSERKYRTLVNNIPDVIWTSDSEGNATFISPNVEKIYGYTPQEIYEQRHRLWLGRVHPDDVERVERAYRALLEKNVRFDVEYRIQKKDGQWIWLHDRAIATYEKDGVKYADGIFTDITVDKVVDMALRESQTNLALAQQIAHVGSWEQNLETGAVTWSDETYRLLGFAPGHVEPTFKFFLDTIHSQDRESVKIAWEKAAREEQPHHVEFRIIRADGAERVLDNTVQVVRDSRGEPLRVLGVVQDITERRRAEQGQKLRFQILETLNQQASLRDTCARILSLIRSHLNCDAVALRLVEDDEYPYFAVDGFSQEFIETENRLMGCDCPDVCSKDSNGNPPADCMCGVVLDAGFDRGRPFFTDKGSFWTNSTTELMASTTAADRCGANCTNCNEHGYESVALIPIESDGHVIGLLQVNARRKNFFSLNRLVFLEELGFLMGVAVERRKAEQALQQSEEKFRRIAEQGFDVVLTADLDGTLTYVSPSARRVFGYSPEEMTGRNAAEFTLESGVSNMIPKLKELAEGKSLSGQEVAILRKDASEALIELNCAPIRDGGHIIGVQASARNITERRRAENALRESEGKYRTLVESFGESIALIDEDGVFRFMNTTGARRLGGKPGDCIGKTMWDLFPEALAQRQMAIVKKVIEENHGVTVTSLTELQGQLRWYDTTIEPLAIGGADRINGVMVIARDIHDIKHAEEELARYREKMTHAEQLASLGTLSATVAHELTQPLTVIRLSLDNLLDDLKATSSPETHTRRLEDSLVELSNITSIIDRFRTFARKSSQTSVGPVELKAVAVRIAQLLGESARRARIALHIGEMNDLPAVHVNERDFEQLFFALIQNAVQAADGKRPRKLVIGGALKDQYVELRFADDCGGIAPENLDLVLEPFFTTKPPGQGTGLGLSIVQQIASRAGGKVSIESEDGRGTTFIVTLPVDAEAMS